MSRLRLGPKRQGAGSKALATSAEITDSLTRMRSKMAAELDRMATTSQASHVPVTCRASHVLASHLPRGPNVAMPHVLADPAAMGGANAPP